MYINPMSQGHAEVDAVPPPPGEALTEGVRNGRERSEF